MVYIIEMIDKNRKICRLERAIIKAFNESGLTQAKLAQLSGIDRSVISRFLEKDRSKRRTLTLPVADRLCKVLALRLAKDIDDETGS